jgi:hypothetical protein
MADAPSGYALVRQLGPHRWDAVDPQGRAVELGLARAWPPALCRVTNPHVARVLEVGEAFIAYAPGTRTARQWLAEGRRSDTEIIRVWWNVLTGLGALHRDQLVHGRVTPDHVFVEPDGRVFVGAFALELDLQGPYAAPELARHESPTAATDQYGAAASLKEALPDRKRIAAALARAMSPDPAKRFVSVTALGNVLVQS